MTQGLRDDDDEDGDDGDDDDGDEEGRLFHASSSFPSSSSIFL